MSSEKVPFRRAWQMALVGVAHETRIETERLADHYLCSTPSAASAELDLSARSRVCHG